MNHHRMHRSIRLVMPITWQPVPDADAPDGWFVVAFLDWREARRQYRCWQAALTDLTPLASPVDSWPG